MIRSVSQLRVSRFAVCIYAMNKILHLKESEIREACNQVIRDTFHQLIQRRVWKKTEGNICRSIISNLYPIFLKYIAIRNLAFFMFVYNIALILGFDNLLFIYYPYILTGYCLLWYLDRL